MRMFCASLLGPIVNNQPCNNNEMLFLKKKQEKKYKKQKLPHMQRKNWWRGELIQKLIQGPEPLPLHREIQRAVYDICNLRYKLPKYIFAVFLDGTNCNYQYYQFIVKVLAKEFESQFKCLWENREVNNILYTSQERK